MNGTASSRADTGGGERRRAPRVRVEAPYTHVRVRRRSDAGGDLDGHVYDLSRSGARVELDVSLPVGEAVKLDMELPGQPPTCVRADATVVRHHDPDEVGPTRMGIHFTETDTDALKRYLDGGQSD